MYGDFHSFCDWVNSTHSIEDNVDRANEYFPDAVQREEVTKEVEVLALENKENISHLLTFGNWNECDFSEFLEQIEFVILI